MANAPLNSEEWLAQMFAERRADTLRYVAKWAAWLWWDDTRWRWDHTRHVFTLARELCCEVANSLNKPSERKRVASAKTRATVVALAGEDRCLVATVDQWDRDPWLLNTPDGVIDLHTGKLRAHRREDYCTKITAVGPGGKCPRWRQFLREITDEMPQHVGMDSERHLGGRPKPGQHPAKGNRRHRSAALAHEDISSGFLFALAAMPIAIFIDVQISGCIARAIDFGRG